MKFPESLLRGRMAETIVSEMLQDGGYFVYRFGYEGILQSLVQRGLPRMNKGDIEAEKIRTMPDFIVMKNGDVSFVEVKFRSGNGLAESLKEWGTRAAKYWPEARLIIVRPYEPHFSISTVERFAQTGELYPLVEDRVIAIDGEIIKQYEELICKYCHR
ncbi:MAG: hypothetical protein ACE5IQ_03010 [Candidatus Methylomirabilales bacterium]